MKALPGRWQIPLPKVGSCDRRFFNDSSHPAQCLLNNLARADLVRIDDGDRSVNGPYGHIESVILHILGDFDDDVGIFEEVNCAQAR